MAGDIDGDIARWILEFLVRQPLDDRILSSLVTILPLSVENSSLKKSLLLRRIESEISTGSVSEKILDFLEEIEELESQGEGKQHSDLIKGAYCSVAVACTVKFLKDGGGNDSKFRFFDAVKRIWRGRVCKMEKTEKVGLLSEDLKSWRDEVEAAVWDESAIDNVLKRSEGLDAVAAVRFYVEEEKENTGPSFLELVADALRADDNLRELLGMAGEKPASLPSGDQNLGHPNDVNRDKGNVIFRRKHIASKRSRAALCGTSRGAKITDTDASGADLSCKINDLPSTPEVNVVQEALKSSSLELNAVVKDPLPEALRLAEAVLSSVATKDACHKPAKENCLGANPSVGESSGTVQANGETIANHCCEHQNGAPKPSLMARNGTAYTIEWDDSIDGLPEESPNCGTGVRLPSPKRGAVSPLKIYEMKNMKKRRKMKRWSASEEETLRMAVDKFGRGNWKLILHAYRHVFEDRTEVDLKDKWRNMTR